MCHLCLNPTTVSRSRRRFLSYSAAGAVGSMFSGLAVAAGGPTTSTTADQALAKLKAGNERFVAGPEMCQAQLNAQRDQVAKHQMPWATVLACADSRLTPELVFGGAGIGELFVVRNAGSMADTAALGSIEYGAAVLGVPLIVVLGHQRCGAVAAACEVVSKGTSFPGSIGPMVEAIVPAAKSVVGQGGDFLENANRANVIRTAQKIATESPIVADLVKKGKVKVVPAVYSLDKGRVEFVA